MKCLSLWQPWASLIACGAKPYETRDWAPPRQLIGQRIAIHAAKMPARKAMELSGVYGNRAFHQAMARAFAPDDWSMLPLGAIVCTALMRGAYQSGGVNEIGEVVICASVAPAPIPSRIPVDLFGNYGAGRWLWLLTDVQPLAPPAPCRGRQKLFDVPDEIARRAA